MYNIMKILINKKFYETADIAQNKINVFYSVYQLSDDDYAELTILINTVYGE